MISARDVVNRTHVSFRDKPHARRELERLVDAGAIAGERYADGTLAIDEADLAVLDAVMARRVR